MKQGTAARRALWFGAAGAVLWCMRAAGEGAAGGPPRGNADTGALAVFSSPATADIFVDDGIYLPLNTANWTLYQMKPGIHTVSILPHVTFMPGSCSGPVYRDVLVEAGKTAVASFSTDVAYGTVRIRVRDADSGAPLEGAYVFSNDCDDIGHTGADGDAVSYGLAAGRHAVVVFKDGFAHSGIRHFDIEEGVESCLEVALSPAGSAGGSITVTSTPPGATGFLDYWDSIETDRTFERLAYGLHRVSLWKEGYLWPPPQTVDLCAGNPASTASFHLVPMPIYFSGSRAAGALTLGQGVPLSVVVRAPAEYSGGMSAYIALRKNDGSWYSFVFSGPGLLMVPGLSPVVASARRIPSGRWDVIASPPPAGIQSEDFCWVGAAVFPAGSGVTLDNWREKALGYVDEAVFIGR